MSFLIKDDQVFIITKLTDVGRKKISEGKFKPTKFKIGDSEIDYSYYKEINKPIGDSFVLKPKDRSTDIKIPIPNVSGDVDYNYTIDSITSTPIELTKELPNLGFFDGNIYDNSLKIDSKFIKQPHLEYDLSQLNISKDELLVQKTNEYGTIINDIEIGDYLLVGFNDNPDFKLGIIDPDKPKPYLWYKITSLSGDIDAGGLLVGLDRDLPNLNTITGIGYCYVFPKQDSMQNFYYNLNLDNYWESGFFNFTDTCNTSPTSPTVWNMNILYTDRICGVNKNNIANDKYYSSSYNGFLNYISSETYPYKNIGIIHFTNIFSENILGDELLGDTIELILPTIMWSQNLDNKIGLKLSAGLEEKTLDDNETVYYDLVDDNNILIGKIFHKLKTIIIEDQELLFAMSYKSNRNWTLPKQINNFNIGIC